MTDEDPFKPLFHHYKVAGHDCDVTKMRSGGYRCECICGWFNDLDNVEAARYLARHHIDAVRREAKRARDRVRNRRLRS